MINCFQSCFNCVSKFKLRRYTLAELEQQLVVREAALAEERAAVSNQAVTATEQLEVWYCRYCPPHL